MSSIKPLRMVVLGAPGSGKGTLTSRLLKNVPHIHSISTGDLLRNEISKKSSTGLMADSYIKNGALLPDNLMAKIVETELSQRNWLNSKSSFLLDGFPRTIGQAKELDPVLDPHGATLNFVVELNVPSEVILDRIANRWVHSSGRVYNLQYNPPKVPFTDDVTGEPLVKRSDDNPETFKIRLDNYFKQLEPIKEYYQKKNIFHTVTGETSDIIFPQLLELVEKQITK